MRTAFENSVRLISALPDGSLEVQFFDGQIKRWEMPPKPAKVLDKPVKKRPAKDRHLYWYCRAKSHHGVTCDSVNYPDSEMKEMAFPDGSLEIHFYDGRAERWQR